MSDMSRREFVAVTTAAAAAAPLLRETAVHAAAVTAIEVVDRIKKNLGGEWGNHDEVDAFKAGDPSTVVTGIVTTSMATLDVLQKARQARANLVITAAPTFYTRADLSAPAARGPAASAVAGRGAARGAPPQSGSGPSPAAASGPGTGASAPMPPPPRLPESVVPPEQPFAAAATPPPADRVYAGKNDYIARHKLVVFRLSDHWNQRKPDPRAQGLAAAMAWTKYKANDDMLQYDVPPITLDALASRLKTALGARGGIRVIGHPAASVRRVGLLPGYTPIQAAIAMLPTVDAIVAGEVQEWESAAYAQDVVFAGIEKGFISIGRVVNEALGMQVCADWLKTIVPEVPVGFVSAGDPYWRPI